MEVELLYSEDCPNWRVTEQRLEEAGAVVGADVRISRVSVATPAEAERRSFRGSPTVLVDGVDPFSASSDPIGLSCRVFRTPDGLQGAPTVAQLVEALR